jgi:DivIVA domain-containing protein
MDIEPESIERRDFSTARRGYDRAEVDAHLREIAATVERLRQQLAAASRSGSLSAVADERLRPILDAAEASAAEIRSQADDEARQLVGRVEERTSALLARADSLDGELDELVGRMRSVAATAAESLRRDVSAMQAELEQLPGGVPPLPSGGAPQRPADEERRIEAAAAIEEPAARPEREVKPERPPRREPSEAPARPEPPEAPARPEPSERLEPAEPEPSAPSGEPLPGSAREVPAREADEPPAERDEQPAATTPARTATDADLEAARLIALNMALGGSSRDETADYLRQTFGLEDRALLDDVYERTQGT